MKSNGEVAETVAAIMRAGIPIARDAMVATACDGNANELDRLNAALYLLVGVEKGFWPLPAEVEWATFNIKEAKHD